MKLLVSLSFAALLAGATLAQALPASGLKLDEPAISIAGGCGPGWHRGPYGGCRKNFKNPAAHACPRGFHIGPGGRCRGNGR